MKGTPHVAMANKSLQNMTDQACDYLQVLSDPRQKRFFKSKDMRDLFTLGDEYANATETSEIFASVNGEVTATLAAEQAPLPELNHAEGGLGCTLPQLGLP